MKTGRILNILLAVFLAVWLGSSLLLHSEKISSAASESVSSLFEKLTGTHTETGKVSLLRPSGISVEDLLLSDLKGDTLAHFGKIAVRFKPLKLLRRKFDFSSISLFSPDIRLSVDSVSGIANWQFLADKFSGGGSNFPDLRLNSIIIRNGRIKYDIDSIPPTDSLLNRSHIGLSGLTANISVKALSKDSLNVNLRRFSFREQSGLELKGLSGKLAASESSATVNSLKISLSNGQFIIDNAGIDGFGTGGNKCKDPALTLTAHSDGFKPSDLSAVLPALKDFSDNVTLSARVSGKLSELSIDDFSLASAGKEIGLSATGNIEGIREYSSACVNDLHLNLSLGRTPAKWLNRQLASSGMHIPSQIDGLQNSTLTAKADGSLGNFNADAVFNGKSGHFTITINNKEGLQKATLATKDLNLASILKGSGLGKLSLDASAYRYVHNGNRYSGKAQATVSRLDFNGHNYNNATLESNFNQDTVNASFKLDDSDALVDLTATYVPGDEIPSLRASMNARDVDLYALGFVSNDSIARVRADLSANLKGSNIDNLRGEIEAYGIEYENSAGLSKINSLNLIIRELPLLGLSYTLNSDILSASASGHFKPSTLATSIAQSIKEPLPTIYALVSDLLKTDWDRQNPDNVMKAGLRLHSNEIIGRMMHKELAFKGDTKLEMELNDKAGSLSFSAHLPQISSEGLEITAGNINIEKQNGRMAAGITVNGGKVDSPSTMIGLMLDAAGNRVNGIGTWNRIKEGDFDGTLMASLSLSDYDKDNHSMRSRIDIDTTDVTYNGIDWHISPATVIADSSRLNIEGFRISHQGQYVDASGRISADSADVLDIVLHQINLDNLLSMLGTNKMGFKGIASGHASISSLIGSPAFSGHVDASDFSFMETYGGNLSADAIWNTTDRQVELVADLLTDTVATTHATGLYRPGNDSIDVRIYADNTDLYFLNRFMPENIFSEVRGRAHGMLRLFGNGRRFDLEGTPVLTEGYFDVIPVNTVYLVPYDTLRFTPGRMEFTGIHVNDQNGHSGLMDCTMSYTRMQDFRDIKLAVDSKGLQILNMEAGSGISGRLFIDGTAGLECGSGAGVMISGNCSTAKGSWLNVDLSSNNVTDNSFLTIVGRSQLLDMQTDSVSPQADNQRPGRKLYPTLSMDLMANCTENAEIGLAISSITGKFRGQGDIAIKYNDVDGIEMYGRYAATQGGCNLSIPNLIDKKFNLLEDDSYVLFTGNPAEAQLNLHTYYTVNSVSLYDLDASASTSQNVRARCLLDVTGQATSPEFSFDVDLPHGTAEENAILSSATATDEQRNMQFMYLLAIGKFYTYDYANQASTAGITPSTMESLLNGAASGQLNSLLAEVFNTDVLSISSNINAGNYLNNDPAQLVNTEFEGILEAHLLDNRLLLNGNFGYRNNAYTSAEGLIGDFEVKYLISPKYGVSVRGYSRNNDRYFTKTTLTTQGVGLVYEKDFDRYFKRRKNRSSKKNQ